ncbi:DUF2630 family protein [Streptomyces hoynatensis]|uniref:DUF2630 family protein n=1 Tax=Streptomyces hoynatensis TaxID=1141874 RepID=A0A3A9YL14_9ACTN|nr:DUF2630 family protein [Streptomyces hoynatensis]RKN37062.1 DUF2630 family protein [Streptomyces hoynatensis]
MDDKDIIARVGQLVAEERDLRESSTGRGLGAAEQARLLEVEAGLDQCWDLLRQRRAKTEFGADPNEAAMRPAPEVEGYDS